MLGGAFAEMAHNVNADATLAHLPTWRFNVTLSTKTRAVRSGTSRLRRFTTGYLGNCIDLSFPLAFNLSSHLYRIGAIDEPLTNYEFLHNCA